jgi:hypothetical protein
MRFCWSLYAYRENALMAGCDRCLPACSFLPFLFLQL